MLEEPSPKSWRRRLRVSVRTMMTLVLILGGGLGWLVHRAHLQRDAVAAIQEAGGVVYYDWQRRNGINLPKEKPPWPKWLVDQVGVDYFSNVVVVGFGGKASDVEMLHVEHLSRLEFQDLNFSSVTDAGLGHLKALKKLQYLPLAHTALTDMGLGNLEGLTNLQGLNLDQTGVSDTGLDRLKGLTSLRSLVLSNTEVSDAGLLHLKGLNNLVALSLADTQVSDSGLAHLKGLPKLKTLLLARTKVTEAGVQELQKSIPMLEVVR